MTGSSRSNGHESLKSQGLRDEWTAMTLDKPYVAQSS
jgi:hypothetical protein